MRRVVGRLVAAAAAAGIVYAAVIGAQIRPVPDAATPVRIAVGLPGPTAVEEGDPVPIPSPARTVAPRATVVRRPVSTPTTRPARAPASPRQTGKGADLTAPRAAVEGASSRASDAAAPVTVTPAPPAELPPAGPAHEPVPASVAAPPAAAAPRLTPPVPVDQPPLHPLMKTVVTSGPLGVSGLEELSVRGRLRARLLVRTDGTVGTVEIVISSGDAALDQLVRDGLLRWRFVPATSDGVPIEAHLVLWVTFRD